MGLKEGIYRALITGDKSSVPRKTIQLMKDFGLMHLLTPSGLHLGSFLLLFKFFPRFKFLITLSLLVGSFFIPGFLALKRMLIFYTLNHFIKNTKLTFLLALGVAIAIGNYAESPLSFSFTLIFWGAIVFHDGGKLELAIKLFALQALIALCMSQDINLAALCLNPLITGLFTALFPVLLFFYPLEFTRPVGLYILESFEWITKLLEALSFLNASPVIALLLLGFTLKRRKLATLALLFYLTPLQSPKAPERKQTDKMFPLPSPFELMKVKGRKIHFIDRNCTWSVHGPISCRQTRSNYSNPSI